ncbi:molybdopterin cofactor-binding domain-containing protein [Chelatococcus sp. GCM10030263]|uniref:xanthine dehydrogenase family protein molybdopterin-binding subunit n=1 Tax=Chelatococcus sp. GCM10030263 TaxID=3273387 RepID=UPI00361488D0
MNAPLPNPTRRGLLAGGGALILSFSVSRALAQETQEPQNLASDSPQTPALPGSLEDAPFLDSWIRIDADGAITVFTGKVELGQGIKTALLQVAAEELAVAPTALKLITADTSATPNEGYTAGSHSMQDSGTAIRHAAAQVRQILIEQAASRWQAPPEQLKADGGAVVAPDGRRLGYGALVAGDILHVNAASNAPLKGPDSFTVMGKPMPRVDIPAKVTGGSAYVQDMRLPGMVHARVVRPPSPAATLEALDTAEVERLPGVLRVVRDGNFLAVVAEREWQAIKAMRVLAVAAQWQEKPSLPPQTELPKLLTSGLASQDTAIHDKRSPQPPGLRIVEATFTRPYQLHGSMGPSCAVGHWTNQELTIWTHTQGVYPDRKAISEMLGLPPERVRCIHVEGSGCYGHNGADDAAADAALIARAVPGRPVRVQWMREQEHAWEPYGPAMVTRVSAALDSSGRIADWDYGVWSNTHATRPGPAGALLAARHLAKPFAPPPPKPLPQPEGGGDRNAIPLYNLPSARVVHHFLPDMPLRVSAMRGLGAYVNIFSIESFMDELAAAAGVDPVEFRLRHMEDSRARDVISVAAEKFGWANAADLPKGRGRGFAFARYKNLAAYCALATEVEVERETGRARLVRVVAAVDSGELVNPDGIRNQIEGGILQSMSWTLYESVTFDDTRITSIDWASYPILRFDAVPDSVEVHIVPRPGMPFLGTGEAAQGPAAAAVGNAVAHATGVRFRDLPLTREKIKAAIGA